MDTFYNQLIIFIIIIFVIIVSTISLIIILNQPPKCIYEPHPKIIWTFWDDPNTVPATVKMCMNTWRKYNPNYEIILLTKENYSRYVDIPKDLVEHANFNDCIQRFSDLVRIHVMAKYGGIWSDASVLMSEPLDNWIFKTDGEFDGYYIEKSTKIMPVIENWFFGVKRGSQFMEKWKNEFCQIAKFSSHEEYVDSRRKMGIIDGIDNPTYLAMHIAAQKVLQVDKYPLKYLNLRKAEDGPFRYVIENGWGSKRALEKACADKEYRSPLLKMTRLERHVLEEYLKTDLSQEKCQWE